MFLLTAVVAAWAPYVRFRQQIPKIRQQIVSLREMAQEMIVEDPNQITIVYLPQTWDDEHQWDIYLPEGNYRMRLAAMEIDDNGFPPEVQQTLLSGGRHRIGLLQSAEEDCWRITVTVDDRPSIETVESLDWHPRPSFPGFGGYENRMQVSADEPVTLFGQQFTQPTASGYITTPKGPSGGLKLWIERIGEDR